jgi:chromatin remodeling complex protein RSC6
MTKTFTQNDVIRYIYDDIPENEKQAFENAMICDVKLLDLFHELRTVKKQLDKVQNNPRKHVIKNILDYSKSFNLHSVKK